MTRRLLLTLALVLPLLACSNKANGLRDPVNPIPTPTPPPLPRTITVDYRVTGTIPNTHITYFSTISGTTQVTTDPPWSISFQTTELHPFLYLAGQSPFENAVNGSIIVQIFVDGVLFREARGNGFEIIVAASGDVP